jgi:hypothetical protein
MRRISDAAGTPRRLALANHPAELAQRECGDVVGRGDRLLLAWLQRRELERLQNRKWGSVFPSMEMFCSTLAAVTWRYGAVWL